MQKNELHLYQIKTNDAEELASNAGYFQDLTFAADALRQLLDNFDQIGIVTAKSLWSAALIAYARCFAHGRRINLSPDIYKDLKGDAIGCHDFMMGMRNRHIAHSVNPFEDLKVGAVVKDKNVDGVATIIVSHQFPDKNGIENLYQLICVARKHVQSRCKELQDKCLESTKKLKIDDVLAGDALKYTAPGPEHAGKDRGRKKK